LFLLSEWTEDLGTDCAVRFSRGTDYLRRRLLLSARFFVCRRGMVSVASLRWLGRLEGFDAVEKASLFDLIFRFRATVWLF
jgi:hypothetical protein